MQIRIKTTKIDLTPELREYIQKKADMLEKYLGDVQVLNCDVEVGLVKPGNHGGKNYRAEINLELPGDLLRVEKVAESLHKAIDKVKDHLARSIKRYKDKS